MLATQGGRNGCSRAHSSAMCSKWLLSGAPNHNVLEIAALLRTATQGGRTGCSRMDRKQKTRTKHRLWPKTEFVLQGLWPKTVIVLQGLWPKTLIFCRGSCRKLRLFCTGSGQSYWIFSLTQRLETLTWRLARREKQTESTT